MKHITIHECYSKLFIGDNSQPNTISEHQARELEQFVSENDLDTHNVVWGRKSITFINYVGFIKLKSFSIEILPKVDIVKSDNENSNSRKALLNMLAKTGFVDIKYSEMSYHKLYNRNLFDIFGHIFALKLEAELSRGPHLEYITINENKAFLKGKLLLKNQISNLAYRNSKAYCSFEEFECNNLLNQIYKRAIGLLIPNVKNIKTINKLKYCNSYFLDVDRRLISEKELETYSFNRMNLRFEPSFLLAKMFIMAYSSSSAVADKKSFSFLFKMNDLFELYIAKLIRRHIDRDIYIQDSRYKLLVNAKSFKKVFPIKPDIIVNKGGKEKIIIDTKWKRIVSSLPRHGLKREDLYQMHAYLTRYEKSTCAILLYPHNKEIDFESATLLESWFLENNINKSLKLYSVDLSNESETIKNLQIIINSNIMSAI